MSQFPPWFFPVFAAILGLMVGSFLNVVIHRLPRGESLSHPPSRCPRCGAAIRWYDNVPLLSYLLLGGRCRDCRGPISPRYPLVEAATGLLFLAASLKLPHLLWALHAVVLGSLCLALALIDLEHMILPDALTLPGVAIGLLLALAGGPTPLLDAAIGTVLGAALPLAIIWAYRWLRGVEGMGFGDVKLLAMLGAFLGWQGMLLTLSLAAVAGALVGVGLMVTGRGSRQTELPFGTFLCAAAVVVLFWGEKLAVFWGWSQP